MHESLAPFAPSSPLARSSQFLNGGGECGALIRSIDWSKTPLGPVERWSPALRTSVAMMLQSKHGVRLAWGLEFTVLYNDAYRPILGASKHPFAMGQSTIEAYPEAWGAIEPLYRRALAGETVDYENLLLALNRGPRGEREECYFTFTYLPVRNESGEIEGLFIHATETTEHVLSLRELEKQIAKTRHAEMKLHSLVADAPVGIAAMEGPEHVFTVTNEAYRKLFFEGRADLVGRRIADAIPEAVEQGYVELLDRVYRTGQPYYGTEARVRIRQPGGEREFHVNFIYQASRDADGKISGVYCIVYDVTELVKARKKLEASEEKYRSLAETMPDLMWTASPEGKATYANKQCLLYTGMPSEEKFGDGWVTAIHPEDAAKVFQAWNAAVASGAAFCEEYRLRSHAGEYRWFLGRAVPVRAGDATRSWIGTATDIHEQKIALSRIKSETQLREQFVATLTHDLRNPLTGAKLSAQLLARNSDSPEKVTSLSGRIVDSIERANRMIENLLDASRIKVGEPLKLNKKEVELCALVQETLHDLTTTLGDRFVLSTDRIAIEGLWDADSIRRIVDNLCGNAVKYGASDSPITVSLECIEDQVAIHVHNRGNPIPAAELPSLFDPFRRAAKAAGIKGWGLGLTVVRGLAEAHGGRVDASSDAESGTVFSVRLPRASGAAKNDVLGREPS